MEFHYREPVLYNNHYNRSNNCYGTTRGQFNNHGRYTSPSSDDIQNHFCETCDRGFRSAFLLEKHIKEHMTCSIDGCQFVAHPKIIMKHIEMQHSTGLYNKIGNLNNPEAIAKWREERRKKYPTKENIEKKNAALKEKVERGEKMGLKHFDKRERGDKIGFKHFDKRVHERDSNNKRKRDLHKTNFKRKSSNPKISEPGLKSKITHDIIDQCGLRRLKPFEGVQSIIQSESEDDGRQEESSIPIEDEDEIDIRMTDDTQNINNSTVCGALSSLIMNYDSSDDEELSLKNNEISLTDNIVKKQITSHSTVKETTSVPNEVENSKINNDNDSGPEEVKIEKLGADIATSGEAHLFSKNTLKSKNKIRTSNQRVYKRSKVPSTLLEKLLNNEIRHERNVTLQCIRFIIKNNFFSEK